MEELSDFSGFTPALKSIEITPSRSMISGEGDLVISHLVKLVLGTGEELIFSVSEENLQKMFFLILRIVAGKV